MKWFKHMSDMAQDVKVKRLIRRYGVDGYGLYNYALELICRNLDTEKPLPDLEESATDIAEDLSMDTVRVEEIMWFCIEQGLFSQDEVTGRVVAHKIYKFLDTNQTRSVELQRMIKRYHDGASQTVSDSHRLSQAEQNRTEQNRIEEGRAKARHPTTNLVMNQTRYDNLCQEYGQGVVDDYMQRVADWASAKGRRVKDGAGYVANWLKRDEIKPKPKVVKVVEAPKLTSCPACVSGNVRTLLDEALCLDCGAAYSWKDGKWRSE